MVRNVALLLLIDLFWSISVHAVMVTGKSGGRTEVFDATSDEMGDEGSRGFKTAGFDTADNAELKRILEAGNNEIFLFEGKEELDGKGKLTSPLSLVLQELIELKEAVNGLKAQNNFIYKQMKSYHKTCSVTGPVSSSSPSLSSFVSSASAAGPDAVGSMHNAILSDALRLNPIPKPQCREEFTFFPDYNGCYKLTADRVTWRMARERCLAQNSDLVSVESSRKQRFLIERAKSSPETRHCDFWIGLSRHSSSLTSWKWSMNDDTPTYTNWNFNEPNNGKGNEHCAQMLWIFHWKWNDAACNYGNACYICQAKSFA